jgi:disulfide bond formation protein DsbB
MSADKIAGLAGVYSLAMILGVLFFQYVIDVPPCEMCYWQRWPLEATIVIGLGGAWLFTAGTIGRRAITVLAWSSLILIAISGAIGFWQAGLEWNFFHGPASCTGERFVYTGGTGLSNVAPVVRCDVVYWDLFGISLAGYNTIFSLGTATLGAFLLTTKRTFLPDKWWPLKRKANSE